MKKVIKTISAITMAFTILGTGKILSKTISPNTIDSYIITTYAAVDKNYTGWKLEKNFVNNEMEWHYYKKGNLQRDKWIDDKYYVNGKGALVTGFLNINGDNYYCGKKTSGGAKWCNAWVESGGEWYYYGKDGKRLENTWLNYKGYKYYLGEGGRMYKDCTAAIGLHRYYFNSIGVATVI
ncbi:hypothetical protein [Ruminococcus flavefaciens]|uniref:Cell wall binding repeat-containing protein n=1 Tax=Ruminococcus flavefaciens TaxID=1265 RepID=A0A1M7K3S8_RUMFL|nr:hypothetical protein [Ruminococcus flavefaciens]SHM59939.1 hypothetical protein SAMN04487860_10791 [Ruminococcus flavefaciens]